jgi:hypothetical protein
MLGPECGNAGPSPVGPATKRFSAYQASAAAAVTLCSKSQTARGLAAREISTWEVPSGQEADRARACELRCGSPRVGNSRQHLRQMTEAEQREFAAYVTGTLASEARVAGDAGREAVLPNLPTELGIAA